MSDALPLPPRPRLEQFKKLAIDLQQACTSSDSGAVRAWAAGWIESVFDPQGSEITPEIRTQIDVGAERIAQRWHSQRDSNERTGPCEPADAESFVARGHGFSSWLEFAGHIEAQTRPDSPVPQFEAAVDAIVDGDLTTLERLLSDHPELTRARSTREHRSTLLHYVSANGVEDFRQKTPQNIVEIARRLLEAGADVNAESEAYGGKSTTLGLTATSCHPEHAGVQLLLMELLLDWGAIVDGPDGGSAVNGCLHNGRGEAAKYFARRGARLDLEAASGLGLLDLVKSFFEDDGSLKPPATERQALDGFAWACEFGRTSVVDYLLQRGIKVDARLKHDGQTGLHWAAYGGHADTVELLLQRGATVDAQDESYRGTPLGWALYGWGGESDIAADRGRYDDVVAILVQAGATWDSQWFEDDEDRRRAARKARSDPRMLAALRGEMPG